MGAGSLGFPRDGVRLRGLRKFALIVAAVVLVAAGAVLVVNAVRDAQPGFRDGGELASAIGGIDGYEADCGGLTETDSFSGGSVTTHYCDVTKDGQPATKDGVLMVLRVSPTDAMDEFRAAARTRRESPTGTIVGENWVINGLAPHKQLHDDLLKGLDGARSDRFALYSP